MDEDMPHLSSHLLSDTHTKGCTVHTAQLREIYAWAPAHVFPPEAVVIKKMMSPCSICDYVYTKEGARQRPYIYID